MTIRAEPPIATVKEATRRVPKARQERAPQLALGRLYDGVDAFADRLIALVFMAGTAQAFE